jgi:hypothetical protein
MREPNGYTECHKLDNLTLLNVLVLEDLLILVYGCEVQ